MAGIREIQCSCGRHFFTTKPRSLFEAMALCPSCASAVYKRTTTPLETLRRHASALVETLGELSPDDADRFDAALDSFWNDYVSMLEIVEELRIMVDEEAKCR